MGTNGCEMNKIREMVGLHLEIEYEKMLMESGCAGKFEEDDPMCLSKSANKTINFLARAGEITPSQLAKALDIKNSSVTSLLDSLEKDDLVSRKADLSDRRKTLISLTENGYNRADDMLNKICMIASKGSLDATEDEIDEAISAQKILLKFHKRMHKNILSLIDQGLL